jgi:hypothetical protein
MQPKILQSRTATTASVGPIKQSKKDKRETGQIKYEGHSSQSIGGKEVKINMRVTVHKSPGNTKPIHGYIFNEN